MSPLVLIMQATSLSLSLVPTATSDFPRYVTSDVASLPDSYGQVITM